MPFSLERWRAALPWSRVAVLLGATVVGLSQILFEIILGNPDHFPRGAGFHLWTLFWALLLPCGLLLAAETFLVRRWGPERAFRAWRAALYALLALSFLRQVQAHQAEALDRLLGLELAATLGLLLGAGVFWAAWKVPARIHAFAASLGVLALILTGLYVARSGLLGPAWARPAAAPSASPLRPGAPPVWILLCDELSYAAIAPDGRVDEAAFPAFAELARDGLWFRDATTNHQWTHQAVPTLLTGHRNPPEGTPTLFQRLPDGTAAMIIDPWLPTTEWIRRYGGAKDRLFFQSRTEFLEGRPLAIARYLALAFSESAFVRLPAEAAHRQGITLYTTLDQEIEVFLDSADPAKAPGRLTYWHCPLPHQPFLRHADGRTRKTPLMFGRAGESVDVLWEAYREQARYLDGILGAFTRRLKERGLYERSILIVTSDHGLRTDGAMEPAGYPDVRGGLVPRIPLILRAPGLKPGVSDVEYQHIDFAPTVLDLLDVPYDPAAFEGRSALADNLRPRKKSFSDRGKTYERTEGTDLWRLR
ncbi:MAG TPA: sulfatase-like hydrolase/transferase [Planctomycetota bacterium]